MFIHPLNAKTAVTNITADCVQPNAVDLKIQAMYVQHGRKERAMILKNRTSHSRFIPLQPSQVYVGLPPNFAEEITPSARDSIATTMAWVLKPNHFYQFETAHTVDMGEGEIGWVVGRSSLVRNGLLVSSGIYDAGFRGNVGGVIHNPTDQEVVIEVGARVAQLVIAKSESIKSYDGQYQDKGVVT